MSSSVANQLGQKLSLMSQADIYEIISLFKKVFYTQVIFDGLLFLICFMLVITIFWYVYDLKQKKNIQDSSIDRAFALNAPLKQSKLNTRLNLTSQTSPDLNLPKLPQTNTSTNTINDIEKQINTGSTLKSSHSSQLMPPTNLNKFKTANEPISANNMLLTNIKSQASVIENDETKPGETNQRAANAKNRKGPFSALKKIFHKKEIDKLSSPMPLRSRSINSPVDLKSQTPSAIGIDTSASILPKSLTTHLHPDSNMMMMHSKPNLSGRDFKHQQTSELSLAASQSSYESSNVKSVQSNQLSLASSFETQPSLSSQNSSQLSVAKNCNHTRFSNNSTWTTQSNLRDKCFPIMPPEDSNTKNVNETPFKLNSKLFEQNPSLMSSNCSYELNRHALDSVSLMDKEMLHQHLSLLSNRISLNRVSPSIKSDSTLSLSHSRSSSSLAIRLSQRSLSDTSCSRGSTRTPLNSPIDHEKFSKLNSKTNFSNKKSDLVSYFNKIQNKSHERPEISPVRLNKPLSNLIREQSNSMQNINGVKVRPAAQSADSCRDQSNQKCFELVSVTDSDAKLSQSNVASYDSRISPIYLPKDKFIQCSISNTLFSPSLMSSANSTSNSFLKSSLVHLNSDSNTRNAGDNKNFQSRSTLSSLYSPIHLDYGSSREDNVIDSGLSSMNEDENQASSVSIQLSRDQSPFESNHAFTRDLIKVENKSALCNRTESAVSYGTNQSDNSYGARTIQSNNESVWTAHDTPTMAQKKLVSSLNPSILTSNSSLFCVDQHLEDISSKNSKAESIWTTQLHLRDKCFSSMPSKDFSLTNSLDNQSSYSTLSSSQQSINKKCYPSQLSNNSMRSSESNFSSKNNKLNVNDSCSNVMDYNSLGTTKMKNNSTLNSSESECLSKSSSALPDGYVRTPNGTLVDLKSIVNEACLNFEKKNMKALLDQSEYSQSGNDIQNEKIKRNSTNDYGSIGSSSANSSIHSSSPSSCTLKSRDSSSSNSTNSSLSSSNSTNSSLSSSNSTNSSLSSSSLSSSSLSSSSAASSSAASSSAANSSLSRNSSSMNRSVSTSSTERSSSSSSSKNSESSESSLKNRMYNTNSNFTYKVNSLQTLDGLSKKISPTKSEQSTDTSTRSNTSASSMSEKSSSNDLIQTKKVQPQFTIPANIWQRNDELVSFCFDINMDIN